MTHDARKAGSRKATSVSPATTGTVLLWILLSPIARSQQSAPAETRIETRIAAVQRGFVAPPDDARAMMRWWWFGPGVVKPELAREIIAMKQGGIGGFEIQPVYPMALNDDATNFHNVPYLSDEFLDDVRFAAATARSNGMRVDMTLASGWPYGGPHVPVDQAAARLRVVAVDAASGATSVSVPSLGNGETLLAAFVGEGSAAHYDADKLQWLAMAIGNQRVALNSGPNPRVLVFYIASRTGQQVKRAAVNAEGFVLDHFSKAAVADHLKLVGDRLMQAFGETPPYAVFSDSLEVYGSDWTDDLLPEFQRRRGYDLLPFLPQLASGTGERSAELRHDWGLTLTELIEERYLSPINAWATEHHTRFRSQTYGDPAVSLSSNRLVALPEGEGPQWDRFSYTRWATSASHLYGRPVTSAETWTWLHSPAFRATPLDMKAEADRFFLEGVNQLIGHGWPYTPPGVAEPGWSFYAAAVFNDHNPWWIVMPDVMKYMQRTSYLLRQGKPANDVAVLLPNDDAYAEFVPGKVSLSDNMPEYVTPELTQQIERAGYNFDYIDARMIETLGIPYPVLVMPHVQRLSPETLKLIAAYTAHGGKVIAVGSIPSKAPGLKDAATVGAAVQQAAAALFADHAATRLIANDQALGAALRDTLEPDLRLAEDHPDVGFIHRKLEDADVYFVANTGNRSVVTTAILRSKRGHLATLDTLTGAAVGIKGKTIALTLAPYESRVFVCSDAAIATDPMKHAPQAPQRLQDLTSGWTLTFPGSPTGAASQRPLQALSSWADDPDRRFYSGTGAYTRSIRLTEAEKAGATSLLLDFGEGAPVTADPNVKSGMRALLESPIREAAVVLVNGQVVGSVWHPPYTVDVTGAMHVGENQVEVRVANTAINSLAGRAAPNYRLLNARYGERFTPQDTSDLQPLPSGMLGPVRLMGVR